MALGYIGYSLGSTDAFPSPSLWADCLNTILNDKGLGYYMAQDFLGNYNSPATTALAGGIEVFTGAGTAVYGAAASATFGPNVLSMATGATDNNNTEIFGEEQGAIVRGSGKKMWFEARVAPTALGDTAFFIGLTTRANANTTTTGPIADNPSNSAAAGMVSATFIGFVSVQAASAIATVNAVYEKTTGTPVTVLANVGNASAFTAGGTNGSQFPGGAPSTPAAPGNLAAGIAVKYGIRFDGNQTLEFYVNGVLVAKQIVDSTVDQSGLMVPVVAAKNGASTALTLNVDFIRMGFQDHS